MLLILAQSAVSLLLLYAAVTDIRSRMIPNRISVGILTIGLGAAFVRGAETESIMLIAAMTPCLYLAWNWHLLGGGDVKLLLSLVPSVPAYALAHMFFLIAISGGIVAVFLGITIMQKHNKTLLVPEKYAVFDEINATDLESKKNKSLQLPYAVAIAFGTVLQFTCYR